MNGRSSSLSSRTPGRAARLLDIAVDGVGDFLRGVLAEMVVLPGHRPEPAHLPEQPLHRLDPTAKTGRKKLAGLLGQVLQLASRTRTPTAGRRRAAGAVSTNRGDPVVGRNLQELRGELLALADVHRLEEVGEPRFLEEDGDLVPVGRGPVVELDHGRRSLCFASPPISYADRPQGGLFSSRTSVRVRSLNSFGV